MTGKHFTYADLIENMISVDLVVRVERKNDIHTISNKTFDFSNATIRQLIKDGYEEALCQGNEPKYCGGRTQNGIAAISK